MVTFSFYTMHLSVEFNHFNRAHWIAVRCEASGASEATPAVAEASEASGSYLYTKIKQMPNFMYVVQTSDALSTMILHAH